MKKILLLVACTIVVSLTAQNPVQSVNHFSLDLLREIHGTENIIVSPYSIYNALGMTEMGSSGITRQEMRKVLHLPDLESAGENMSKLEKTLQKNAGKSVEWNSASTIWLDNSLTLKNSFRDSVYKHFQAKIHTSDFQNQPQETITEINRWVAEKTHDKIPSILNKLNPLERMVLLNAVYFLGSWQEPFEERNTDDDIFHLENSSQVTVPFMQYTKNLRYYEDSQMQAVSLSYKESSFAMLIILPQVESLSNYLNVFDADKFTIITERMSWKKVNLHLPRFKVEYKLNLKDDLKNLGMPTAFSDKADFSGMSRAELNIARVIHRAYIEVNEKGTEAAAATAVVMELKGAAPNFDEPVIFNADQPFMYFIYDRQSSLILFSGLLYDPS